jgi:hypothetical protein
VTVTVQHLVAGAKVTVGLQLGANPAVSTQMIASGIRARVALTLPSVGTYIVTASATDPNVVFTGATGSVTAT